MPSMYNITKVKLREKNVFVENFDFLRKIFGFNKMANLIVAVVRRKMGFVCA